MLFDANIAYFIWIAVAILFGCCCVFCFHLAEEEPDDAEARKQRLHDPSERHKDSLKYLRSFACLISVLGAVILSLHAGTVREARDEDDNELEQETTVEQQGYVRVMGFVLFSLGLFVLVCGSMSLEMPP